VSSDVYPDLTGVYDLDGPITGFDPIWGSLDGWRQAAVLSIEHSPNAPQFRGNFTELRAIPPEGELEEINGGAGTITGSISHDGRVVIELSFEGSHGYYWYGEGTLASGQIVGRYGAAGHISGTFTAKRR
jgi:hypothetical protein